MADLPALFDHGPINRINHELSTLTNDIAKFGRNFGLELSWEL